MNISNHGQGRFVTVVLPALAAAVLTLLLQGCRSEADHAGRRTAAAGCGRQPRWSARCRSGMNSPAASKRWSRLKFARASTGYIESVNFAEGSMVRKGDLLFVIDPRPYRAELAKAEAELARAVARAELSSTDVERSEKLLGVKAVSREEYDQRLNAQRESQANVEAARAAVDLREAEY